SLAGAGLHAADRLPRARRGPKPCPARGLRDRAHRIPADAKSVGWVERQRNPSTVKRAAALTMGFASLNPSYNSRPEHQTVYSGPAYFPAVSGNIDLTILNREMSTVASMCRNTTASR